MIMYMHIYIYIIYIYIYIYTHVGGLGRGVRKGTNGVSTHGVAAISFFLTDGLFGYSL